MNHPSTISITANGETFIIEHDTTLPQFLEKMGLSAEQVVVERNRNALTPGELSNTVLAADDKLEIVRIVAGG